MTTVPSLAKPPPEIVKDVDGKEWGIKRLVGGTGKHAYIYNYFVPMGSSRSGNCP